MDTNIQATDYIHTGEHVVLTEEGQVTVIRHDCSRKARFIRWIGRGIHFATWREYGYDQHYIIGYALNDSVYDEEKKSHMVTIDIQSGFGGK